MFLLNGFSTYVNQQMRFTNGHILLFVDNTPPSNIQLHFLPANMTLAVQPLDQAIIQNCKQHYRKFLLQRMVSVADSCTSGADFRQQVNVLDAIRWLVCSWNSVTQNTIRMCFRDAGFIKSSLQNLVSITDEKVSDDFNDNFNDIFDCLVEIPWLVDVCSASDFINIDNNTPVHADTVNSTHEGLLNLVLQPNSATSVVEDDEEDATEFESPPLTWTEAIHCVQQLRNFVLREASHLTDSMLDLEAKLEGVKFDQMRLKVMKQTTLDSFIIDNSL